MREGHDWALVLAGGQGKRMQHLTRIGSGVSVPKQFCSLGRGPSLLHQALLRARSVAPPERILISLTEAHRCWWTGISESLPADNILVQPGQRGTGIGILHALLEILHRDPQASLVILPSDHFFRNEAGVAAGLREALEITRIHPERVLLLGFEPDEADPDLGYILPGEAYGQALFSVRAFTEKPGTEAASALLKQGALTNSFIVAANGHALLEIFERQWPEVVAPLRDCLAARSDPARRVGELACLFAAIPSIDFSGQVLANNLRALAVLRVAPCGWSDLGTPARLERVLHRHRAVIESMPPSPAAMRGQLDLVERSDSGEPTRDNSASSLRS